VAYTAFLKELFNSIIKSAAVKAPSYPIVIEAPQPNLQFNFPLYEQGQLLVIK
jgi:hypothetical protein